MPDYRFSLTLILPYKNKIEDFVIMGEHAGQRKPVLWHILRSVISDIFSIYVLPSVNVNFILAY